MNPYFLHFHILEFLCKTQYKLVDSTPHPWDSKLEPNGMKLAKGLVNLEMTNYANSLSLKMQEAYSTMGNRPRRGCVIYSKAITILYPIFSNEERKEKS